MQALVEALRNGFAPHADDVSVMDAANNNYVVYFDIGGRRFACGATAVAAGFSAPEETTFMATTWVFDPLEAFGRRMDMRLIDGFDQQRNPDCPVRSGKPAEIAEFAREAAVRYAKSRWGADEPATPAPR